jgi:formylglycine-generating enzyme required for sulfatase activity
MNRELTLVGTLLLTISTAFAGNSSLPAGMEFVLVTGGSFEMGSPESEEDRNADEFLHSVTVGDFELMTTEVTQGMWERVMGENPASDAYGLGENYPVYYVSWDQCQEFITRLNEMDPSHEYRLPTEAEWEFACRAGSDTRFFWGSNDNEGEISRFCWYLSNSSNSTNPVAQKEPNDLGLFDMSGNVLEWCEDVYTVDYSNCPTDGAAYLGSGSSRVYRGGAWHLISKWHRSATRYSATPGTRRNNIGFRVARVVIR